MADNALPRNRLISEIGSPGLNKVGGYIAADFLPQLQGLSGVKKYTEMATNDPLLSGIIFMMTSLIRNVDWRLELPEAVRESKEAVDRMDRLHKALFEEMETPFEEVIGEACSMFTYGFAPCEVTYKRDDGGAVMPRRISLRSQETVQRWEYAGKDGREGPEWLGLWQDDFENAPVFIPKLKLLLFRTTSERDNPEGRSVLRGAYVPWIRKKAIEEAEGRVALRAAGLVVVRVPGEIFTPADDRAIAAKAAFLSLATKLATDRQGSVLLPSDVDPDTKQKLYDVEYVGQQGAQKNMDMSPIIERMDKRMAGIVMADFILLGQGATGSYALSSDKTTLFANALGSFLHVIEAAFNRQLIRRVWQFNGWPIEEAPRLVSGDIEQRDLGAFGSFLANLSSAGMPLFPDDELEDWIRVEAGLPKKSEEAKRQQEEAKAMEAAERQASVEATQAKAMAIAAGGGKPPAKDGKDKPGDEGTVEEEQ